MLNFLQLSALVCSGSLSRKYAKRWEAIALYVELSNGVPSGQNELDYFTMEMIGAVQDEAGQKAKRAKILFSGTPAHCKDLAAIANNLYPHIIETTKNKYQPLLSNPDRKCPLEPLVLTPPLTQCCGVKITIRNRPSFPTVYTSNGTFVAATYHGQCLNCKTTLLPFPL